MRRTPCCQAPYRDKWNRGPGTYCQLVMTCSKCGRDLKFIGDLVSYENYIFGGRDDKQEGVQIDYSRQAGEDRDMDIDVKD